MRQTVNEDVCSFCPITVTITLETPSDLIRFMNMLQMDGANSGTHFLCYTYTKLEFIAEKRGIR